MEHKLLAKLDGYLQYTKLQIFEGFSKWLECKILDLATNLLQWFDVFYPQKDKVHQNTKVVSLWEKIHDGPIFLKNWLLKKVRFAPWMEEHTKNFLTQIGSYGVLQIPSTTNVLPLLGGYGVVCNMRIERFNHIPNMLEFVGKTLKIDDDK